eukprot:3728807-Rhodomonas_salina.2
MRSVLIESLLPQGLSSNLASDRPKTGFWGLECTLGQPSAVKFALQGTGVRPLLKQPILPPAGEAPSSANRADPDASREFKKAKRYANRHSNGGHKSQRVFLLTRQRRFVLTQCTAGVVLLVHADLGRVLKIDTQNM